MIPNRTSNRMFQFPTREGLFIAGPEDVLGKGTYGTVFRAYKKDDPSIRKAIKTFAPETIDENEGIPSTTLREINAMKTLNHPNLMSIDEVVIPSNRGLVEMFVVMELCQGTLKDKVCDIIKKYLRGGDRQWAYPSESSTLQLPPPYIREVKLIAWQMLNAVAACHSKTIVHRDLKPANMMWSYDDKIKIGDFGLARFVRGNQNVEDALLPQTGEVQTLWYRAPEVIMGDDRYGMLVDDWSIGCIIAEMFRFRVSSSTKRMEPDPLFNGRGDSHTLMLVFETLGTPKDPYLERLTYWSREFPHWKEGNLRKRVRFIDDIGFDLLQQLLQVPPSKRKAARFLLNHAWFNDVKETIQEKYIPWFHDIEASYNRLKRIEEMPAAQRLNPRKREFEENKENEDRDAEMRCEKEPRRAIQRTANTVMRAAARSRSPNRGVVMKRPMPAAGATANGVPRVPPRGTARIIPRRPPHIRPKPEDHERMQPPNN